MPIKRIDGGRRLTESQREVLLAGRDFFNELQSPDARRMLYEAHEAELLESWREEHGMFCRPARKRTM